MERYPVSLSLYPVSGTGACVENILCSLVLYRYYEMKQKSLLVVCCFCLLRARSRLLVADLLLFVVPPLLL